MAKKTDEVLIKVDRITKRYGPVVAVQDVSFEVKRGEILGLLGPNGAGKTTTMKTITCFLAPTSGRVLVKGHDTLTESMQVRRAIGYLPEDTPLYKEMSVLEFLIFVAELREVDPEDRAKRLKETCRVCGIAHVLGRPIGHLSKGYRQRVGLAQAMLHDPDILLLDEPWTGLDPNQISDVRGLIKELGQDKTVVISTHILAEVEAVCDRVIIIDQGRIVADEEPNALVRKHGRVTYRLSVDLFTGSPESAWKEKLKALSGVEDVAVEAKDGTAQATLTCQKGKDPGEGDVLETLTGLNLKLRSMRRDMASLEDVFREMTVGEKVEIGVRAEKAADAAGKGEPKDAKPAREDTGKKKPADEKKTTDDKQAADAGGKGEQKDAKPADKAADVSGEDKKNDSAPAEDKKAQADSGANSEAEKEK